MGDECVQFILYGADLFDHPNHVEFSNDDFSYEYRRNHVGTVRPLLRLIRRYLEAGILEGKTLRSRSEGTPQGGPLSPLLSNILLNELDKELEKRGHRFVRYADDVSIFLRSKRAAKRVRASITRFLNRKLLLEVNEEKTSICRPVNFTLLGHGFVPTYKKGERGIYRLCIAKKSWVRLKMKIKVITRKTSPIPFAERIQKLNELMRGWVHYFKHATGYQKLKDLDGWVRSRLRYCIYERMVRSKKGLIDLFNGVNRERVGRQETPQTPPSCISSIGHVALVVASVCLFPNLSAGAEGRLAAFVQSCYENDGDGGTTSTTRVYSIFGVLSQSPKCKEICSLNRRVRDPYALVV